MTTPDRFDMADWLDQTRLVVCVGAGGVGKTTTAAGLAVAAALRGRKVMVLTIDPARRLANSLGLASIGNEQTAIDLTPIDAGTEGELWAMMLDSRSSFDSLISRVSPDEESRRRILDNHVYRHMADTFAGSQDYMATETLYDIVSSGEFDLVVLDTPPVKNALDFLESPGRLINFLDERVLRWFLRPYDRNAVFASRLMMGTSAVVYRLLGYVFGRDFLDDLAHFFQDFQGLYEGFVQRNQAVMDLFRDPETSFVAICAPTETTIDVATFFEQELARRELPHVGLVVNQVHRCDSDDHDAATHLGAMIEELRGPDEPAETGTALTARLGMAHRRLRALRDAEQALLEPLRQSGSPGFYQEVQRLDGNVHDLTALARVGQLLLAPALARGEGAVLRDDRR